MMVNSGENSGLMDGEWIIMVNGKLSGWWLSPTPLKNMSSSVGIMTFPIYGKIKFMFQTTNQNRFLMLY